MSRTTIKCPHCGQPTRVDFSMQLSTQKCDRCSIRFSSVNTGSKGSREIILKEPPSWRRTEIGEWDEEREAGTGYRRIPRWGWAAAAAALLLAGGTMVFFTTRRTAAARPDPVAVQNLVGGVGAMEGSEDGSTYELLKTRIDDASAVARRFLAARTPEEVLPLIQERAQLERTVREYYEKGEGSGTLPLPESRLLPVDRQLWVEHLQTVVINYAAEGRPQRAVALRRMEDGQFLVEWPSAVAFNEVPLARFIAERQTTPRLCRLLGGVDDYYNRAFSNDQEFICLNLSDPDFRHSLYGYARRRSKVGTGLLAAALPDRSAGLPVLVRLRFPDAATTDNQVEIAEFIGTGWVEGIAGVSPTQKPGTAPTEPAPKPGTPSTEPAQKSGTPSTEPAQKPGTPSTEATKGAAPR